MAFPVSINGALARPVSRDAGELSSSIVSALHAAHAKMVTSNGDTIVFKAGIFRFVTNWNVLVPVGSGIISITTSSIEYRLSLMEMLIVVTSMVIIFFGPLVLLSGGPVFSLALPWAWLFGGNYLLTLARFPSFLKQALEHSR